MPALSLGQLSQAPHRLLTVFPRWRGLPELERWRYLPVGLSLFGGQLATLLGAFGWPPGVVVGAWLTLGGWLAGIGHLLPMLCSRSQPSTVSHARTIRWVLWQRWVDGLRRPPHRRFCLRPAK